MRYHATLTANLPSLSLASLFQAAAGRAWARTRPTRAYHRTSVRSAGAASIDVRTVHRGHDGATELGGPSSSVSSTSYATHPLRHDTQPCLSPPISHTPSRAAASQAEDPSRDSEAAPTRASAGSPSLRPRRRHRVTHVDVDRLLPEDIASADYGHAAPSDYESDPPWEEIRDSVPECFLQRISPRRAPTPKWLETIPKPSTPEELLANLVLAVTASSPASLGQVLSYHAAHRTLHSTASFNFLVKFAIRNASFGTVQTLLQEMVCERIPGDLETRTLRVRCMVRTGFWEKAWREEMALKEADGQAMPLPVWLEFFGDVKRGAIWVPTTTHGRVQARGSEPLPPSDPPTLVRRINALLENSPLVTPADLERIPPRALYAVVRALVAQGQRSAAIDLTSSYFKSLPHDLDDEWRRSCLSVIHLHMRPDGVRSLAEHYAARDRLFGFLGMHHSFRPTSTTLFMLLRSLRKSRRCGKRAEAVMRAFARRWGPDVVDDAVRRRVASYWVRQGDAARAQAILEEKRELDEQRAAWRVEKEAVVGDSIKDRARRIRWLDLHRSPLESRARRLWKLLRQRLGRARMRQS
ncbi:hypothetical protein BD413DRAFT_465830 [Trametes elegans]|nr:hypothetical protein BD413DRAFT_465830 [Trametes elegans]